MRLVFAMRFSHLLWSRLDRRAGRVGLVSVHVCCASVGAASVSVSLTCSSLATSLLLMLVILGVMEEPEVVPALNEVPIY